MSCGSDFPAPQQEDDTKSNSEQCKATRLGDRGKDDIVQARKIVPDRRRIDESKGGEVRWSREGVSELLPIDVLRNSVWIGEGACQSAINVEIERARAGIADRQIILVAEI